MKTNSQLIGVKAELKVLNIINFLDLPGFMPPHRWVEHNTQKDRDGIDLVVYTDKGIINVQVKNRHDSVSARVRKKLAERKKEHGLITLYANNESGNDEYVIKNIEQKLLKRYKEM